MHRLSNTLLALLLTMALTAVPAAAQEQYFPWPTKAWATSSPEEQGMSSDALAQLIDFGTYNNVDSFLITRHGRIVLEVAYAPYRVELKHRVYSVTKSVISTLIGMALDEGKLDSVDRKILDFFPGRAIANLDDAKRAITIRQLLDMRSGLAWQDSLGVSFNAMERSPDWQQFVLDHPMENAPGTTFNYSGGNTHLLSAILSKATGKSAHDYAREKLFAPLGIDDVLWRHDPQGISGGGAGLYLQPRDMAKLGYLYLRNGQWEGKQILPRSWIEAVRKADGVIPGGWASTLRYGNQFWIMPRRDAYLMVGFHRQLVIVMPKLDIVVVATGSSRFSNSSGLPTSPVYRFDSLVDHVEAAAKSETALPANPQAMNSLAERLRDAAREKPAQAGGQSELAKTVSGRIYRLDGNPLGVKSLRLKLDTPQPSYEYEIDGNRFVVPPGRYGGPIGFDGYYRVGGRMPYGVSAARGVWLADGKSLVVDIQTPGNDDAARLTHVFDGKAVDVSVESAGGLKLRLRGHADD